ncbi:MAG: hypothetical protein MUO40_10860 [Anaerolineaceae bacterium]|nr:hypothetical protein [Anaerolineaceae bacterium]
MGLSRTIINDSYWQDLSIDNKDIEQIYTHLFEKERPLRLETLVKVLISTRIAKEAEIEKKQKASMGKIYLPAEIHKIGDELVFPTLDWAKGQVINIRAGKNPEVEEFNVIEVKMENDKSKLFASNLHEHSLNNPIVTNEAEAKTNEEEIFSKIGKQLSIKLESQLLGKKEIVRLGETWFPKAMLVDFNQGHLNIAEAILDMQQGGPLDTLSLLIQMGSEELESSELSEFSLNYALKKDSRFDEVGISGKFSWFLKRLEPDSVRDVPLQLQFSQSESENELNPEFEGIITNIDDELDKVKNPEEIDNKAASFSLIYPHWRVGSIPLTSKIKHIFPSALETERVKMMLIDKDTGQEVSGWVVRPNNYVYGLQDWYADKGLIPGSIVQVEKSEDPGVVYIQPKQRRSNREWIKTVLIGADGGIVIALLKQAVSAGFQEQMVISISDIASLDQLWKERKSKSQSLKKDILKMMQELSKLNNQRHVHFTELYACINIIRRCPPSPILQTLIEEPEFNHVGDQYFHLIEGS